MAKKKNKYQVVDGVEEANVNGILLSKATQNQLKQIYELGHPYVKMINDEQKTDTDKQKTESESEEG